MTERGILFSAPMVRALLDGSKTQTRRIMKPQPKPIPGEPGKHWWPAKAFESMMRIEDGCQRPGSEGMAADASPFGSHGDRLWVRETWADLDELTNGVFARKAIYRADDTERYGDEDEYVDVTSPDMRWRPSIHMPRWASRILLEVTGVRVERLQTIGESAARAEGVTIEERHTTGYCTGEFLPPSIRAYRDLWESINGAGSWDANPWVWVVEFRRIQA